MPPATAIVRILEALERAGIPSVYLRNHEHLPHDIGNDVDILIQPGAKERFVSEFIREADQLGYEFISAAPFSSLALYFGNRQTGDTLHVDVFTTICWHFIPYADSDGILARRQWNGYVHIPEHGDELYLNLMSRLIYGGTVRDKHREMAAAFVAHHGDQSMEEAFTRHLGTHGPALADALRSHDWHGSHSLHRASIRSALSQATTKSPLQLTKLALAYASRIARKLLVRPGRFLVIEGADGVGKSTILREIGPWCATWCAGRTPGHFHWKPAHITMGELRPSTPVDPRGNKPRHPLVGLVFLAYHVAGFWLGWLFHVRPLLCKSHSVIGDRYSYDLFLDPGRFRLKLPDWLLRAAGFLTPQPDLVIALLADPESVHSRKPELTPQEISDYQQRWAQLAQGRQHLITISADGEVDAVVQRIKLAILDHFICANS